MHDPARLAQFHNEVRVARTISHRNVCRTYDIGDADGRPFLSMQIFPLTTDVSRPYAGASIVLLLGIAGLSVFGLYASRGDEPLFGRALLD